MDFPATVISRELLMQRRGIVTSPYFHRGFVGGGGGMSNFTPYLYFFKILHNR